MEDNSLFCSACSGAIEEGNERTIGTDLVCDECSVYCEGCSELLYVDDSYSTNDSIYCSDCSFSCDRCNDRHHNDDFHTVSGESWCQHCYENYSFYCESCDDTYNERAENSSYVDGQTYCEGCFSSNCYYCEDCNESYHNDNPCDCNDTSTQVPHVEGCSCSRRKIIHSYGCKPELVFRGNNKHGVYLGFELETQIQGAKDIRGASNYAGIALDTIAILKDDGSIGDNGYEGFEIVTHPHTHSHYREKSEILWDTINKLRTDYTARSWDTIKSNGEVACGLHIHVSRDGFNSGAHTHRFISFIYKNSEMMIKFAGRKSEYATFNDVYIFNEYDKPVFSLKHKLVKGERARYKTVRKSAVNTQNEHTLELRFFRGTMNVNGILSALDLTQAMVEYTREMTLDDVKLGMLNWNWFADYVESNNGIYPDLYQRMNKIGNTVINSTNRIEA